MSDNQLTMQTLGNHGWIAFSGPDKGAAMEFYSDVLDWTIAEIPMQDGSSHPAIMIGETPVGGFSPMPEDTGAWTVFVTVADVDKALSKAEARGATVLVPAMDMPGVGRMATIKDPQGARIAMITYESMQG